MRQLPFLSRDRLSESAPWSASGLLEWLLPRVLELTYTDWELEPFAREVLAPARIRDQGWFDSEMVTAIVDRHVSGREDLSRQIWVTLQR